MVPVPFALPENPAAPPPRGLLPNWLRQWLKRWVLIPDIFVPWARSAAREAAKLAARDPLDLVVTTSPPESVHWIGYHVRRATGCRWLADFRDGWTFEPHRPEAALPLRNWIEAAMERRVVSQADWITGVTRPIVEDFCRRHPGRRERFHFLPTGFDIRLNGSHALPQPHATFPHAEPVFRVVYTGQFGLRHRIVTPEIFLAGLRRALEVDAQFAQQFRLTLVGAFSPEERALWSSPPLASRVEEIEPQPYEEAQRIAAAATMLLLVTPPGPRSITTRKLFDYLAAGRPIFALAEGNEAARIIEETHSGMCVAPDNVEQIAQGLLRAFILWREGKLDEAVPCSDNHLYEAQRHYERVLGDVVLAELSGRSCSHALRGNALARPLRGLGGRRASQEVCSHAEHGNKDRPSAPPPHPSPLPEGEGDVRCV